MIQLKTKIKTDHKRLADHLYDIDYIKQLYILYIIHM